MIATHHPPTPDHAPIRAVSILSTEHQIIRVLLDVLDGIRQRCQREHAIPTDHAQQVLEVIATFVDGCHHTKEERILFTALEAQVQRFAPTQVLRHEHDTARKLVAAIATAVRTACVPAFLEQTAVYAELMRAHIAKEDRVLFPLADTMLDRTANADLLRAFQRHEHADRGVGTHERMLAAIDRLADTYAIARPRSEPATCRCHHHAP